MSANSITRVRRRRKLTPTSSLLSREQTAQAVAIEVAWDDFNCFPSHQQRYKSVQYKTDLKRIGETRPFYDYVKGGDLPVRTLRIKRIRKFLKVAPAHIVQAFKDANLSFEDVADAFEHISREECQSAETALWEKHIEPPFEPLYVLPLVELDPDSNDRFTPSQALVILTGQLAQLYEEVEQQYSRANHYIGIGQVCFEDDVLEDYVRQRARAEQEQKRLSRWRRAVRYGATWEQWQHLSSQLQTILDSRSDDKRYEGLRVGYLFGALVKVEPSAKY